MQINLTKPQTELFLSEHPFTAMVSGYGAGKTHALIACMIAKKLQYPESCVAMYEPSYDLAKNVAMARTQEVLDEARIKYAANKSDYEIVLQGYGKIIYRSMTNPERIVGYETAYAFVDELDTLRHDHARLAWQRIVARTRQKGEAKNQIYVGTTPEGFRFVYDRWYKNATESYKLIKASTMSNVHNLPDGYIDNLRDTYPQNALDAYIDGEFVNLEHGTVYNQFDIKLNDSKLTEDGKEGLRVGMDFNVTKMYACVAVMRGDAIIVVDEIVNAYDTADMIRVLNERYQNRSISIHADASGGSRKTVNASVTDISLLRSAGFTVSRRKSNPLIRDRVTTVNAMLCNGNSERSLFVNGNRCPALVDCLLEQAYDKNGMPEKGRDNDHAVDALGYLVYDLSPGRRLTQKIKVY
jgi:PBSX family phage terminase large subunit